MAVLRRLLWLVTTLFAAGPVACNTGGEVLTARSAVSAGPDAGETNERERTTNQSADENTSAPDAGSEFNRVTAVAAATDHSCVVMEGRAYCFGANNSGQIGAPERESALVARPIVGEAVDSIAVGYGYTCLRLSDGGVGCFGLNDRGQLGSGDHDSRAHFERVDLPGAVRALSAKFGTACVVLEGNTQVADGTVYCWGANENNQCGTGTFVPDDDVATPVRPILDVAARDVAVGRGHTCVLSDAGEVWCWGSNGSHELGLGPDAPGLTTAPNRVSDLTFTQVAAGQNHTCAVTSDRRLYCWGDMLDADGHPGPMGHDDGATHDEPAQVGEAADWTYVATDTFHSCGLRGEGELWCWGRNAEGQLGVGSEDVVEGRVNVNAEERFMAVAVGRFHTCALRDDGAALCTGKNDNGELASGDVLRRATLTRVR